MLISLEIILISSILIISVIIIGITWEHLGKFYHKRYTFFEFVFITIYFSEQLIFLLLYNLVQEYRSLWVSLIVLIVVTTASVEKLLMYIRQRGMSATLSKSLEQRKKLTSKVNNQNTKIGNLHKTNKKLIDFIDKTSKKRSKKKS